MSIETMAVKYVAMMIHLKKPDKVITTEVVETDLNRVCRDVFARAGFEEVSPGQWALSREAVLQDVGLPAHIAISAEHDFMESPALQNA